MAFVYPAHEQLQRMRGDIGEGLSRGSQIYDDLVCLHSNPID